MTRAERRQATRRRLLDAAEEVFARRGFHGTSVGEVAAAAGFTEGAVYSNFASKGDLFVALIDERLSRQVAAVEAMGPGDPEDEALPDRLVEHATDLIAAESQSTDTLLTLEFLLYAVRERPDLRDALAERYRDADRYMAALIRAWHTGKAGETGLSADELALAQSVFVTGLATRLLVDPEVITPEMAVRLLQRLLFGQAGPP